LYIQNEVNTTLQPTDEQLARSYSTVELKLFQRLRLSATDKWDAVFKCWSWSVGHMLWQSHSPYQLSRSNSPGFGRCHKLGGVVSKGRPLWSPTSPVSTIKSLQICLPRQLEAVVAANKYRWLVSQFWLKKYRWYR